MLLGYFTVTVIVSVTIPSSLAVLLEELIASERHHMKIVSRVLGPNTNFSEDGKAQYATVGDIDNQYESPEKLSKELSYETAWTATGKRQLTIVKVNIKHKVTQPLTINATKLRIPFETDTGFDIPKALRRRTRNSRELYGRHRRYYIRTYTYAERYPFHTVVKLSTGCTGTLVSPRHVLTAAHCLHTGRDYTKGFRTLRVGFLLRNRTFQWVDAVQAKLPLAWTMGQDPDASRYDYAIVRLAQRHKRRYMSITYSEDERFGRDTKIHFTAFEDDKPSNTIWYRTCFIRTQTNDMLYHCCDAQPGSSGAGIYASYTDKETGVQNRRIIGVFSGNRNVPYHPWWPYVGCPPIWRGNFNAGIRLNSLKFEQICSWLGEKHSGPDCVKFSKSQRAREPTAAEQGLGKKRRGRAARKAAKNRKRNKRQKRKKKKKRKP